MFARSSRFLEHIEKYVRIQTMQDAREMHSVIENRYSWKQVIKGEHNLHLQKRKK